MAHWINTIAVKAPEAPVLLVGTHKDELTDADAELSQAQTLLTDFVNNLSLAKNIIPNIRKPSASEWFFGVDSKSRRETGDDGAVECSDPMIAKFRRTLEEAVANDDRKVTGWHVVQDSSLETLHVWGIRDGRMYMI